MPSRDNRVAIELEPRLAALARSTDGRQVRAVRLEVEVRALLPELALEFARHRLIVRLGEDAPRDS